MSCMRQKFRVVSITVLLCLVITAFIGANNKAAAVQLDGKWQKYSTNDELTWTVTITPEDSETDTLFFYTIGQSARVWLNDWQIYDYGKLVTPPYPGRGQRWHMVLLPEFSGEMQLRIQLKGNDYGKMSDVAPPVIDNAASLSKRVFGYDIVYAAAIPVAVLLIMILGLYYFNQTSWKRMNLRSMILLFDLALWTFSISHVRQLWFDDPIFWWYVHWGSAYALPICMGLLIYEVVDKRVRKSVEIGMLLFTAGAMIALCIYLTGMGRWFYAQWFYIIITMPIQVASYRALVSSMRRGNRYAAYTALPAFGMSIFGIIDVINIYCHFLPITVYLTPICIYCFIVFIAFMLRELLQREYRLEERSVSLEYAIAVALEKAEGDPLTGCRNRRGFERFMREELPNMNPKQSAFIMLDIDWFKRINDTLGHDQGDVVLQSVARLVRENIDKYHRLFRWGGEEFIIFAITVPSIKRLIWLKPCDSR